MAAVQGCLFNIPHVDATKTGNGCPLAEAKADPPSWDSGKTLLAGQRHVKVNAPPHTTFRVLGDCFNGQLAAEVATQAWALHVMAFLDYEAVQLKVEVYRDPSSEARTEVLFRIVQADVVQFRHVCSMAMDHLSASGLQVLEPEGGRSFGQMLVDTDFYDDPLEPEEDWRAMFDFMLRAAGSPAASLREQGLQTLTRWAGHRQDCIPALADALLKHSELVGQLLQAPLPECYPLAVALKITSGCPQDAERLAGQVLPLIPWPKAGLASLVARELEEAFRNLTMAKEGAIDEFSRVSTSEPTPLPSSELSTEEEEVTSDDGKSEP